MRSLPLDLLRNVLSRLPTKSLLKFRSVCREWRDIIDDPQFAAMQATSGTESLRILLLSEPCHGGEPRFVVDEEFLETSLPKSTVRYWPYVTRAFYHGLLYFEEKCGATYLLNPLTRETLSLPSVDAVLKGWRVHSVGFGVDRLTSRYKILRRAPLPTNSSDNPCSPPDDPLESQRRRGTFRISSFVIAKEEFAWTPCPKLQDAHLVDLHGVLGLVDCTPRDSMDVWVMEESGRWMKERSVRLIPPLPVRNHRCLNVLGCGGRKIVVNYQHRFWFYDPVTDELKCVTRGGAWRATEVGSTTVSLLSPAKLWNSGVAETSPD
ncbi:F-box/LRR-repeat protein At2g43260-like [Rhodamnia argentea]|uniref:F-box/LRR-repeat protein At2g43260-like n=1 Tax=Rhodamnia argentea TaxID=178133 RepID=A0ABM3HUN6_9MYRT|nr:F-box/LRR-repeat protein At2g43260-like [Rhodamnia argentea]